MAIDTRDKRASALRMGWLPLPDGSINAGDRKEMLWQYRLEATPPPTAGLLYESAIVAGSQRFGTGGMLVGR